MSPPVIVSAPSCMVSIPNHVPRVDDIIVKISLSPKYRVFSTISFGIALGDSTNLRCWPSISVGDSTDIRYWSRIGVGFIPTDETIAQRIYK